MKKTLLVMAMVIALAMSAMAPAMAQGDGTQIKDSFIEYGEAFYDGSAAHEPASNNDEVTLGDSLSGVYFGNTSNPRPDGNGVLPSQSPGPVGYDCHLGCVISTAVTE